MIDTLRHHETPEGVALTLRLAGPLTRCGAWLLDALLRGCVYGGLLVVLAMLGQAGMGIFLVFVFLLEWFWAIPFEVSRFGATPGKRVFGLRVVQRDGTPVSLSASFLRNLLRAADFFPIGYGLGICTMLATREFQRLGDLVADTVVVHDERTLARRQRRRRAGEAPMQGVAPRTPPLALEAGERRALAEFAARSDDWSRARRAEVAGLLSGLTHQVGDAGVNAVLGFAAWSEDGR